MSIGPMRDRIVIERRIETRNAIGDEIVVWDRFCDAWAEPMAISGTEFMAARSAESDVTMKYRIRTRPGIDTTMRVRHGLKVYGIVSALPSRLGRQWMELTCTGDAGVT